MDYKQKNGAVLDIYAATYEPFKCEANKSKNSKPAKPVEVLLSENTMEGIAKYILEKPCKSIVVLSGAGVSTRSGIRDVRTPGTGFYYTMNAAALPYPHAMFEIRSFQKNPKALYNTLYPYLNRDLKPTLSHYFITLLQNKNVLLKNYTQNADDLEKQAGVDENKIGQINGTFNRFRCLLCKNESSARWVKSKVLARLVPKCDCGGVIKPKMFFYGEALPQLFCHNMAEDMKKCDLLIILGTSLSDEPVASMPFFVDKTCPRLVMNRMPLSPSLGFQFNSFVAQDVFWRGSCDDGCLKLANLLGWHNCLLAIQQDSLNKNLTESASINYPVIN